MVNQLLVKKMVKKIKGKPSLEDLILRGYKIKKINLYLKQYLTAEIELKNCPLKFQYIDIDKQKLNKLLNFYNQSQNKRKSVNTPRKKDPLLRMILVGYEIEKVETYNTRLDSVAVIHFKGKSPFTYKHMAPSNLGKYMLAYWKFQRINASEDEEIIPTLVNKGSEEKLFQNYKKEVIKSFCTFLGLPNNYNNKNTPIKIKINPTIIETQA